MDLKELIKLACEKSSEFKKKYEYWFVKRGRTPSVEWLQDELTNALGEDFVKQAIMKKKQKDFYSLNK